MPTKPTGPKYRDNKGNPFKCLKDNCKGNRVRGTAFCKKCLEELKAKK